MPSADPTALIDGRPAAVVPLTDRGLQYGDGLFETIAVLDGEPLLWERHMQRLAAGCARLLLPAPDPAILLEEARSLSADTASGVLKLIYTAGSSQRGYARPQLLQPRRILVLSPPPDHPWRYWREGVDIGYCSLRLQPQGMFAGLKHLARLEQVLARREVDGRGLVEGLLLDRDGCVVEAVACNVFAVCDGMLLTPPLDDAGVRGVMRDYVLELAQELGIPVAQRPLMPGQLAAAEEIFLTNSLIGLWPVRTLEGRHYGRGPVAARLLARLIAAKAFLIPAGLNNDG